MEKETRNAIQSATQKARRLLEDDFREQLEGVYDIHVDGAIAPQAGPHLSAKEQRLRDRIVAAIEHKRAGGMKADQAVLDYLRDAAFTTLNRFVALKMLEAREIVQECISRGEASSGFNEFSGLAPGVRFPDGSGYRLYLECIFDELSTEVKVLFDRRDPSAVLWPKRGTFEQLLEVLNATELAGVWGQDETIGWVYQYFNKEDDRRAARYDENGKPKAPQNSRELAVRNQFFTPRYVVQFLSDNTLGCFWYEMRGGDTRLKAVCEYMVRRPAETWEPRAKKDPRDVRILDPACGSGHFLLYCFDLFLVMYEEAWADESSPASEVTGKTLREDYPEIAGLRSALPGLVLRQNLYGVDIDPRCAQIGQLALWMRAQRAFKEFGIGRVQQPTINRANIVIAEPMPGEKDLLKEFLAELKEDKLEGLIQRALKVPPDKPVRATKAMADSLAELVETVWDGMKLAGEMGTLLKIERDLARAIEKGRAEWEDTLPLFRVADYGLGGITNEKLLRIVPGDQEDFWTKAEKLVIQALADYAATASGSANSRRRLFAEDAAQGFALAALLTTKFDVALMNPPFGEMIDRIQSYVDRHYPEGRNDIYAAFVGRGLTLVRESHGYVGAITSRSFIAGRDHRHFRRSLLNQPNGCLSLFLDLGAGVLDGAMVETASYIVSAEAVPNIVFLDARTSDKEASTPWFGNLVPIVRTADRFLQLPATDFLYDLDDHELSFLARDAPAIEPDIGRVTYGLTTKDDMRFVRLRWEVDWTRVGIDLPWIPFSKGGEYAWFTSGTHLVVNQLDGGREVAAFAEQRDGNVASTRRSSSYYFTPSICFSRRSQKGFSARRLRPNACFSDKSAVIVPEKEKQVWLAALPVALMSAEYQRLITAQAKFGSYEIGTIKVLPVPDPRLLEQENRWDVVYRYFDDIERFDETSEMFCGLPNSKWSPKEGWETARRALVDGLDAAEMSPDEATLELIDEWVQEQTAQWDWLFRNRSWICGAIFGRFRAKPPILERFGRFEAAPNPSPAINTEIGRQRAILVDDPGHSDDLAGLIAKSSDEDEQGLRSWFRFEFFSKHLFMYSKSRRVAPIYWQLATPSASYSVWLYIHAFTKDTLFRVQSDYVAGKLAHEERQLEMLRAEAGPDPVTVQRKAIEAQEAFVEELRAFLDEVKRVAPLWNPNLDDGVIINFAPLWHLVPHHKPWQKELKSAWDALCAGKCDWAHLAMHLWPERVVPKCAEDRSLAIAHDLEDVFWYQDDDEKWKPCKEPTTPINILVNERTSSAVKAALKSLMEAPEQASGGRRGRGRR